MSFEIVEKSQVVREITVTVPGDVVRRVENKLVEEVRKSMNLKGFRKGKVPASLVRQRAGASIDEDARRESLQVSVREALNTMENLIHVGEVEIVAPKTEDGGFVAKLNAEVTPQLEVKDYKGLEVAVADVAVTDDDVAADLEKRRERHASIEPVEGRTKVEENDVVMTTLSDPNDAAKKICSAGDRQISLGKGYFNEDLEKQIVGLEIGKSAELKTKIGEDEAVVTVVVNEIKKRVLPELNDDFALDTGEAETLEELKKVTRERLAKEAEEKRNDEIEKKLLEKLRANNPIEIPEGYVKARAVQAIRLQVEQMVRQQVTEEVAARIAQNMKPEELEEYRVDYHDEIVLNAIAKAEKIEVSKDEIKNEAKKWFQNIDDNRLNSWLNTNNASQFVGDQVKRDKALEFVKSNAKISKAE